MDLWKRNIHQYGVKNSYQLISHQVYLNLHFYFVSRSPTAWITVYVRESGDLHDQFIVYDQVSNRLTMNLGVLFEKQNSCANTLLTMCSTFLSVSDDIS